MKGLSSNVELIKFAQDPLDSEWIVAELAVNGIPAIPFSVGKPYIANYSEIQLAQYLERQAISMIERYGDRRNPRPEPALLDARSV